jgi:2OG-Fe(II) oxygenase superfamily
MGKKRTSKEASGTTAKALGAGTTLQGSHTKNKPNVASHAFTSFPVESLIFESIPVPKQHGDHHHPSQASSYSSPPFCPPLVIEELHPGAVWVIRDFFSPKECHAWIHFCEASGGLEYTSHPATRYMAQRECYRMQQSNATNVAEQLYRRLERHGILSELQSKVVALAKKRPLYRPVGCNPNIRVYKYTKGHAFGKHVDGSNQVPGMGDTEITILVYLSDCQGGATRFYPHTTYGGGGRQSSIAFDPTPGTMLLHVHGDHCLEHEGDPVLGGTKYVLRTDMVYASSKKML